MGFFFDLLSGVLSSAVGAGSKDRHRQKSGRYGKKGQFRKERNGDLLGRDKKGRYRK
jgi:hypothetical protein